MNENIEQKPEDSTVSSKPPKKRKPFVWTPARKNAFEKCVAANKQVKKNLKTNENAIKEAHGDEHASMIVKNVMQSRKKELSNSDSSDSDSSVSEEPLPKKRKHRKEKRRHQKELIQIANEIKQLKKHFNKPKTYATKVMEQKINPVPEIKQSNLPPIRQVPKYFYI